MTDDEGPRRPADDAPLGPAAGRNETVYMRLDRNYAELLQELRISETGVQVLFGFLLSISFQQRFAEIDTFEKVVYVTTLLCCALSVGLLVAPVAYHRVVFRRGLKDRLVDATSKFAIAGTTFMLLAIIGSVLLILDFVVSPAFGIVVGAVLMALFLALWVALPLTKVLQHRRDAAARQLD